MANLGLTSQARQRVCNKMCHISLLALLADSFRFSLWIIQLRCTPFTRTSCQPQSEATYSIQRVLQYGVSPIIGEWISTRWFHWPASSQHRRLCLSTAFSYNLCLASSFEGKEDQAIQIITRSTVSGTFISSCSTPPSF